MDPLGPLPISKDPVFVATVCQMVMVLVQFVQCWVQSVKPAVLNLAGDSPRSANEFQGLFGS